MGRVRPSHIKRMARKLLERFPDRFSSDFKENRHALEELSTIESKTIKNRIAGYITTSMEKGERSAKA